MDNLMRTCLLTPSSFDGTTASGNNNNKKKKKEEGGLMILLIFGAASNNDHIFSKRHPFFPQSKQVYIIDQACTRWHHLLLNEET